MVSVVQDTQEGCMEGVQVFEDREVLQDGIELLCDAVFCECDFAQVERADTGDLESDGDDGGCLSLRLGEDDVEELVGARDGGDVCLELRHCGRPEITSEADQTLSVLAAVSMQPFLLRLREHAFGNLQYQNASQEAIDVLVV